MVSRLVRWSSLSLCAIAATALSFAFFQRVVWASQFKAFSLGVRTSAYDSSGKAVITETGLLTFRSDGSSVNLRNVRRPDNIGVVTQRRIINLQKAEEISVDELTESTTTMPIRPSLLADFRKLPQCAANGERQSERILGYEVVLLQRGSPSGGSATLRKEWRAPELNCQSLKEILMIGPSKDRLRIATVREATFVIVGESSDELFEKPASYAERSPSQVAEELAKRFPQASCPSCPKDPLKLADDAYAERRQALQ